MENEKKRIKLIALAFVVVAVSLALQLAIATATAPRYQVNICRNEDCENFVEENTQIQIRHYEQEDGVVYVYVFEKGGER